VAVNDSHLPELQNFFFAPENPQDEVELLLEELHLSRYFVN